MAETITYPVPDGTLQDIAVYTNSVAPSGSESGKSNSISGNTVTVNGGTAQNAFGAVNGVDQAAVTGNHVIVNGGTGNDLIIGGVASMIDYDSAPVTGNSVTINNGTVRNVNGGYTSVIADSGSAAANSNSIFINGGTVNGFIEGGYAATYYDSATANGNTVTISGGTVGSANGQISGGYAQIASGSASVPVAATGNRVNISGGLINSTEIHGGQVIIFGGTADAEATHNTVTISGNPTFGTTSRFYGGKVTDGSNNPITGSDAFTSNTLNVWNYHGGAVGSIQNFQFYNFVLPAGFQSGDTALTVNYTADFRNGAATDASSIEAVNFMGGGRIQQAGESFTLIDVKNIPTNPPNPPTGGIFGNIANDGQTLTGKKGVSLLYDRIQVDKSVNKITATILDAPRLNPQTKSLSEARLSQLAFTNQGSDLIAGQGLSAALDATATRRTKETAVFGTLSGGSSRYKTGSHSDVTGLSLITGLAGNSRLALGKLTLGAFFEYGNANYDSYNSFVNAASVRGNGGIDYTGGGVLAHFEFNSTTRGNAWLESSARFGRATVDFKTSDMFSNGIYAAFDSDSNYAAAHIGAGYHWKLRKQNGFDLYAQYLWSRQNADTAELTTGETVKFETANSERLRLGSRFVYNLNPHRRAYAGIAWEHEFDGEANASIFDYRLDTPKLKGDTCKLELGLTLQPTKTCPVTRNFGIQGYTGKREGIAGSVEVRYEF